MSKDDPELARANADLARANAALAAEMRHQRQLEWMATQRRNQEQHREIIRKRGGRPKTIPADLLKRSIEALSALKELRHQGTEAETAVQLQYRDVTGYQKALKAAKLTWPAVVKAFEETERT